MNLKIDSVEGNLIAYHTPLGNGLSVCNNVIPEENAIYNVEFDIECDLKMNSNAFKCNDLQPSMEVLNGVNRITGIVEDIEYLDERWEIWLRMRPDCLMSIYPSEKPELIEVGDCLLVEIEPTDFLIFLIKIPGQILDYI